jgi:hypothetical protein
MIELIILIAVIFVLVAITKAANRNSELSQAKAEALKTETAYKRQPKIAVQMPTPALSLEERYSALESIKRLLDQGVLTEQEFQAEKESILNASKSPAVEAVTTASEPAPVEFDEAQCTLTLERRGYTVLKRTANIWRITKGDTFTVVRSEHEFMKFVKSAV